MYIRYLTWIKYAFQIPYFDLMRDAVKLCADGFCCQQPNNLDELKVYVALKNSSHRTPIENRRFIVQASLEEMCMKCFLAVNGVSKSTFSDVGEQPPKMTCASMGTKGKKNRIRKTIIRKNGSGPMQFARVISCRMRMRYIYQISPGDQCITDVFG